ncbi:MAG: hypothetical protein GX099_09275 [Clostridiaceae bacterium]|nr:hypothetical protein [Clostridiaceae bacterium]
MKTGWSFKEGFQFIISPASTEIGHLTGIRFEDIDYSSKEDAVDSILERVIQDTDIAEISFRPIGKHDKCSPGGYKVALVLSDGDYHWYRQNPDGTWSHKRGQSEVLNVDASQKIIYDPEFCDRDYRDKDKSPKDSYDYFAGFFEVVP